jgi:SAM-dependent methyltransferase
MTLRQDFTRHEKTVSEFYGSFPYPWSPMYFDAVDDPTFYSALVRQETGRHELGDFKDIWVAGCGTNQALITALQYPEAEVLGTDVSAQALEICEQNAKRVGITNLRLEQRSIIQSRFVKRFDLVVCTGVIHHNPEPRQCLQQLSAALQDHGVLELMVYNKFHRREFGAFQEAVRLILPEERENHRERFDKSRRLARSIDVESVMTEALAGAANDPDEVWADNWTNPHESSYDVQSLWDMAQDCALTIEAPRLNAFDRSTSQFQWTLELPDNDLRSAFLCLDDRTRWQVINLLHLDRSPMLWFFLRPNRNDSETRVSEVDRNEMFLDSVLVKPTAVQLKYFLENGDTYKLSPRTLAVRKRRPRSEVSDLWQAADGKRTGRELFAHAGRACDFNSVYRARLMLTSAEFPHLMLCPRK